MKVNLVLEIRKIVGVTGQTLFCATSVLQVKGTIRTSFIVTPYTPTVKLISFINSTSLGCYLGLLTAIIPKRSWIKAISSIKTQLGLIAHSGDLN